MQRLHGGLCRNWLSYYAERYCKFCQWKHLSTENWNEPIPGMQGSHIYVRARKRRKLCFWVHFLKAHDPLMSRQISHFPRSCPALPSLCLFTWKYRAVQNMETHVTDYFPWHLCHCHDGEVSPNRRMLALQIVKYTVHVKHTHTHRERLKKPATKTSVSRRANSTVDTAADASGKLRFSSSERSRCKRPDLRGGQRWKPAFS